MKVDVYTAKGEKKGQVSVADGVFGVDWNPDLVHQVAVALQANTRPSIAHTKDRSEKRGGGRKPYRQKGTGRARHGSIRSPLWRGGGVTFGPRTERKFSKRINKKMRQKALLSLLSKKLSEGFVLFVDDIPVSAPKTKEAQSILNALGTVGDGLGEARSHTALIALGEGNESVVKSFRNIPQVNVKEIRELNVVDLLSVRYVIITHPKESSEILGRLSSSTKKGVVKDSPSETERKNMKQLSTTGKKETSAKKKTTARSKAKKPAKKTTKKTARKATKKSTK